MGKLKYRKTRNRHRRLYGGRTRKRQMKKRFSKRVKKNYFSKKQKRSRRFKKRKNRKMYGGRNLLVEGASKDHNVLLDLQWDTTNDKEQVKLSESNKVAECLVEKEGEDSDGHYEMYLPTVVVATSKPISSSDGFKSCQFSVENLTADDNQAYLSIGVMVKTDDEIVMSGKDYHGERDKKQVCMITTLDGSITTGLDVPLDWSLSANWKQGEQRDVITVNVDFQNNMIEFYKNVGKDCSQLGKCSSGELIAKGRIPQPPNYKNSDPITLIPMVQMARKGQSVKLL